MPDELRDEALDTPEDEDDRVVADMNVEGMPWYEKSKRRFQRAQNGEPMTRRELWRYGLVAVGAGLLAVAAFGLLGAGFIWFCINVWLR